MNDSKAPDLGEVHLSTSIISIVTQQHPHQRICSSIDNNDRTSDRVSRVDSTDSTTSTAAAATVGPKVVKSTSTTASSSSSSSSSSSMGRTKTVRTVNLCYTLFRSNAMITYWPVYVLKSSVLGIALYGGGRHHKPSSSSAVDVVDTRSDQQSNTAHVHGFMRCGYQELVIELRYVRWVGEGLVEKMMVDARDDDSEYWLMLDNCGYVDRWMLVGWLYCFLYTITSFPCITQSSCSGLASHLPGMP